VKFAAWWTQSSRRNTAAAKKISLQRQEDAKIHAGNNIVDLRLFVPLLKMGLSWRGRPARGKPWEAGINLGMAETAMPRRWIWHWSFVISNFRVRGGLEALTLARPWAGPQPSLHQTAWCRESRRS